MKTEKIDWKESTCPICGKKFIPAPEHVYRRRVRTSLRYLCSYHCVLEYDKNKIDRWGGSGFLHLNQKTPACGSGRKRRLK